MASHHGGPRSRAALGILALLAGCGGDRVEWTAANRLAIYSVVLESLEGEGAEVLVVDPRSRFLVPNEEGNLHLGDFNRYGDPPLSSAIRSHPTAVPCQIRRDGACDPRVHDHHTLVSEPLVIGRRDALVLVARVDARVEGLASTGQVLQMRHSGGAWRVTRTWEDDSVAMPRGFSP